MIKIIRTSPNKLKPKHIDILVKLSLGDDGVMKDMLLNNEFDEKNADLIIAFDMDKKSIIAWGYGHEADWEEGSMDIGIYVNPSYRGKGLGKALVKNLARIAKSKNYKELNVFPHDKPSAKLYASLGAKEFSGKPVDPESPQYNDNWWGGSTDAKLDLKKLLNEPMVNPQTGNTIKIKTALSYDKSTPAYQTAMKTLKARRG